MRVVFRNACFTGVYESAWVREPPGDGVAPLSDPLAVSVPLCWSSPQECMQLTRAFGPATFIDPTHLSAGPEVFRHQRFIFDN